jgi:alcohol dehydrogenase
VESVREGDHVAVPFNLGCGVCGQCRNGHGNVCRNGLALGFEADAPGAFAEQVHLPNADYNALRLPEGVESREIAALGCRFMTAFHALAHRAGLGGDDWVAVHGCGGVGLSTVHIAAALGGRPIAVDLDETALELAAELGAEVTVSASSADPVAEIDAVTDGGADVSVDALGRAKTARNSVRCLRERGTHVQIGLTTDAERGEVSLPTDWMTRWEISWIGSRGMPPTQYDELLSMVQAGDLEPGRLVNRSVDLADVSDRLAAMTEYDTAGVEVVSSFS